MAKRVQPPPELLVREPDCFSKQLLLQGSVEKPAGLVRSKDGLPFGIFVSQCLIDQCLATYFLVEGQANRVSSVLPIQFSKQSLPLSGSSAVSGLVVILHIPDQAQRSALRAQNACKFVERFDIREPMECLPPFVLA